VRERCRVIGTLRDSDLKWMGNSDHIPSAIVRIAMSIASSEFRSRSFPARELRLGEVSGDTCLFHGFTHVGFGQGFLLFVRACGENSGERAFVQPGKRIIKIV